jgi:predicted outer membrane repeat protein
MHLRTRRRLPFFAFHLFARMACLTLAATGLAAVALPAYAQATFTVTVLTDAAAGVASNCSNQSSSGSLDPACSLRDALAAAAAVNGASGTTAVAVNFAPSIAAVGNPGTITLAADALTLPTYTTVQGLTAGSGYTLSNLITIQGNNHAAFSADASVSHAALNNLTITNSAPALIDAGVVTVSQCTFSRNSSPNGGAILDSGTLTVLNSTFIGNTTTFYGGAIYGTGQGVGASVVTAQNLTVSGSTFQGNSSSTDGGAIYIGRDSVGSIDSSTFTGNSSAGQGAAIFINNGSGLSRVTNSILTGDVGGSECAGVGCSGAVKAFVIAGSEPGGLTESGSITMIATLSTGQTCTVNVGYGFASFGASLAAGFGALISSSCSSTLSATAFGSTLEMAAQSGTITSVVFNTPAYFTFTSVANSVIAGTGNMVAVGTTAANLSVLGSYGGPTQTVLPLPGSAALCAITPASPAGVDQRLLPRTTAFGTTLCQDSGAVQTNYGLAFVQQPASTTVNAILSPSPSVQVTESARSLAQSNSLVTIKDLSGSLGGTKTSSTISTGVATFPTLSVTKVQAADTLTALLTIGANSVSATSNAFDVAAPPSASLSGTAVFPSTAVSAASSQVFTFTNTGTTTINITALTVGSAPEFTQTNTCGLTLASGANCTVTITFRPIVDGLRSGSFSLVSNATGYAQTIALTGTGIAAANFTLSDNTSGGTSTALAITAGSTGSGTLKLTSVNGFASSVALTCAAQGSAPTGATCTITSPVTLVAGGTATASVSVITTARTRSAGLGALTRRGWPAYLVLTGLLGASLLCLRSTGLARVGSLLVLLFALGMSLTGCGAGGSASTGTVTNASGTPAGSYTYTVTATGGGVTATQTIALTVQ